MLAIDLTHQIPAILTANQSRRDLIICHLALLVEVNRFKNTFPEGIGGGVIHVLSFLKKRAFLKFGGQFDHGGTVWAPRPPHGVVVEKQGRLCIDFCAVEAGAIQARLGHVGESLAFGALFDA